MDQTALPESSDTRVILKRAQFKRDLALTEDGEVGLVEDVGGSFVGNQQQFRVTI